MVESINTAKLKRSNAPLAAVLTLLGLLAIFWYVVGNYSDVLFAKMYFIPTSENLSDDSERAMHNASHFVYAMFLLDILLLAQIPGPFTAIAGFALLLRARRYLQVSADALRLVDKRNSVLFLRAFEDEERPRYRDSAGAMLDFSLETRLAYHLKYVGPFVAVGSPKDKVPLLGAARARLPDSEWQKHVIEWISSSSLIVMYGGKTHWVNWELGRIIEQERVESMLLIIPELKRGRVRARLEDIGLRIDRIKQVFKDTKWKGALSEIRDIQGVRVLVFGTNGSVVVIRTRYRSRWAYHLAALVGIYVVRHCRRNQHCQQE